MTILPYPKSQIIQKGSFRVNDRAICLVPGLDSRVVAAAARLRNSEAGGFSSLYTAPAPKQGDLFITIDEALPREGYTLSVAADGISISGGDAAGCFYGLESLGQLLEQGRELPCMQIRDWPDMACRGFYHDATRGRVPTVDGVKEIVRTLARYKINSLQLYVEHTFDFKEFRGAGRTKEDHLTAVELLELDQYCYDHFIDFIPSLSTFGHLHDLLSQPEYRHLCELEGYQPQRHFWYERMDHHTIDPSNPQSRELVFSLIDQYLPLFRSRYFNICCDETFDLCKGRNRGKNVAEVYTEFVRQLCRHVTAMGKTVMMWGDIALEHPEYLDRLPEDIIVLNWDYGPTPPEEKAAAIARQNIPQILCPGTASWARLVEDINTSQSNIYVQAMYGYQYNGLGLLNTNWGDFGHPAPFQCALYGMVMGAGIAWNRNTQFDQAYETAASRMIWKQEQTLIPLLRQLGLAQRTVSWHQLLDWVHRRDVQVFSATAPQAEAAAQAAAQIAQQLKAMGSELRHLAVCAEGISLLNQAAVQILDGNSMDDWLTQAQTWFEQYKTLWLADCKVSELELIHRFLLAIAGKAVFWQMDNGEQESFGENGKMEISEIDTVSSLG